MSDSPANQEHYGLNRCTPPELQLLLDALANLSRIGLAMPPREPKRADPNEAKREVST